MFDDNQTIRRTKKAAWRLFDNQGVLLDTQSSRIFGINRTGSRIWDLLETEQTFAGLVDAFAAEMGKRNQEVCDDVSEFLKNLLERGLVEVT